MNLPRIYVGSRCSLNESNDSCTKICIFFFFSYPFCFYCSLFSSRKQSNPVVDDEVIGRPGFVTQIRQNSAFNINWPIRKPRACCFLSLSGFGVVLAPLRLVEVLCVRDDDGAIFFLSIHAVKPNKGPLFCVQFKR